MNLLRTFSLISCLTFASRILGFVRDMLVANYFGATALTDAYFVAFRLPNTLRRLFAEGAFSQAFIPTLARIKSEEGIHAARAFSQRMLAFLMISTAIFSVLGIVYSESIIRFTAQGFHQADQIHLASNLLKIMASYLFFISVAAFFSGMLNTWQHFLTPALAPIIFNISLIGALFLYRPAHAVTIYALAWGVIIAGVLQVLVQIYPLIRKGIFPWPHWDIFHPVVRQTIGKMGPAIIGVSVAQISLLINTAIASFLPKGAITWIYFSDRLMEMPTGLIGAAIATVLLPTLANQKTKSMHIDQLNWGLGLALLLTIPATAGLWSLSPAILSTLFLHGSFTIHDLQETQRALNGYLIGLIPLVGVKILATAFYAQNNMKTPIKAAIIALIVTQVLNAICYKTWAQAGITFAISIGAWTNMAYLWIALRKTQTHPSTKQLSRITMRSVMAALVMALLGVGMNQWISWTNIHTTARTALLILCCMSCALVYFGLLACFGIRKKDIKFRA